MRTYRLAFVVGLGVLLVLLFVLPTGLALAVTPTPTPTRTPAATPSPLPPGFNGNANFAVDQDAALPWPLPLPPTFPVASATPTLFNATPAHGTEYAPAAATATYQIGQVNEPINAISTPVQMLVNFGGEPTEGDLDTGVSFGGQSISLVGFAEDLADNMGAVIGTAMQFLEDLFQLGVYTPWIGLLVLGLVVGIVIAMIIELITFIIKSGIWVVNMFIKITTMVGSLFG